MASFSPAQALIAAMITPALLILASASLIATALVRLARVVDRIRKLGETSARAGTVAAELDRHEARANLAILAVSLLFAAVAIFVAAGASIAVDRALDGRLTWLPVALTIAGMAAIVLAAGAMLFESRESAAQIKAEIAALRRSG
jgi:hypothetical protein